MRDSCALPYQLNVDGNLSDDKTTFDIAFSAGKELFGAQSAGAPFNVYAPGKYASNNDSNQQLFEDVKAWSYAVSAGDELKAQWPLKNFENNLYHLRVYGPNGFFREFIGDKNDPRISIQFRYESDKNNPQEFTGNVILLFKNLSDENHSIEIIDNSYKNEKRTLVLNKLESNETVLDLKKSFNWYDISLKIKGSNLFEKRYAGRVETGNHSKSDPFMGKI